MKRKLLLVLSSFLLLAPVVISCGEREHSDIIQPDNPDKPGEDKPVEPDNPDKPGGEDKPVEPDNPGGDDNKDPVDPQPENPVVKDVTLKEANELCNKVEVSYKENFDDKVVVKLNGQVLCDYAISGNYHFMILADDSGILPILINGSKASTGKYMVGNAYEVQGTVGSYRNTNCVKVDANPIRKGTGNVEYTKFATESSINAVYDEAYELKVEENDASILTSLRHFKATYVKKINNNLMLVFDGTKHIILHGDNYSNNGKQIGSVYDFYVMPSAFAGKRGAELIKADITSEKDTTYLQKMKEVAVTKTITDISKTNRYDDNKMIYPFIIKANAYVKANIVNNKYHLAFTDNLDDNVKWSQVNKNPKTVYVKNHVLEEYELDYSNLTPYLFSEPAVKGDFYFVVTDYQSSYHVFQAYVIDELTTELNIQN